MWRQQASLTVSALILVLIAVSCGGGDNGSDTSYFANISAAKDEFDERAAILNHRFDPKRGERAATARQFAQVLSAMTPPASAETAHRDFITSVSDFAALDERLSRESAGAKSEEELDDLVSHILYGVEGAQVADRYLAACTDLERVARDYGADIALNCKSGADAPETEDLCISEVGPSIAVQPTDPPETDTVKMVVSDFLEIQDRGLPGSAYCMPLYGDFEDDDRLAFYTFMSGEWQKLADAKLREGGVVAEGTFAEWPPNLAVLKPLKQQPD